MEGGVFLRDAWVYRASSWRLRCADGFLRAIRWCAVQGIVVDRFIWWTNYKKRGTEFRWHYRWTGKHSPTRKEA